MPIKPSNILFTGALITAIWFALTSALWTYFANLIISYPFLVISYVLYSKGLKVDENTARYKWIRVIWIVGIVFSVAVLIGFLITN